MRRRIDHFDMRDVSLEAAGFISAWDLSSPDDWPTPPPVLRDEDLWRELQAARHDVERLETEVRKRCHPEPLDDVEKRIGQEMWYLTYHCSLDADHVLHAKYGRPLTTEEFVRRYSALRDELRAHNEGT